MKKITTVLSIIFFVLVFVSVFVISLATRGEDSEKLHEETVQVNNALEGQWVAYDYSSSYGIVTYVVSFGHGTYAFCSFPFDSTSPLHEETGGYSIDANKNEISCTSEYGREKTYSYQYDSGYLTISSGVEVYKKLKD